MKKLTRETAPLPIVHESRAALTKSMQDLTMFFEGGSAGVSPSLTLMDTKHESFVVKDVKDLPLNAPLYLDGGTVIEKISDNIVLASNTEEERVFRVGGSSASSSASSVLNQSFGNLLPNLDSSVSGTTPLDEEDSPLLMRAASAQENLLFGGEEEVFSVTVPLRCLEDHVARYSSTIPITGYLIVTTFRVVFLPDAAIKTRGAISGAILLAHMTQRLLRSMWSFPRCFVKSVAPQDLFPFSLEEDAGGGGGPSGSSDSRSQINTGVTNTILRVVLVDGRSFTFEVAHTHLEKNRKIARKLEQLFLARKESASLFALSFRPVHPYTFDGWSVYNFFREMRRLVQPVAAVLVFDENSFSSEEGVVIGAKAGTVRPTEWRVAETSNLCTTYPKHIAVPRALSDGQLEAIAAHRTMGRLPALAFLHPLTGAALVRCSQPRSGITHVRCADDELYFSEMTRRNPSGKGLVIYDARPFLNAAWNRGVKGAGYENEEYYNCKVFFLDIPNIYRVRDSHEALLSRLFEQGGKGSFTVNISEEAISRPSPRPESTNDSSSSSVEEWLTTVSKLLDGAIRIAKNLKDGQCVAVHCSDGWDRTPQLTSLAMLLSDPFYRTLMGFQVLIEWQWIAFGHKFCSRLGFGDDDGDCSPVFLQWLDCCWQLMQQQPQEFEFNEQFLFAIARELYSGRFGTFLGDSLSERTEKWQTRTHSFWSDVNSRSSGHQYLRQGFEHGYANAPIWARSNKSVSKPVLKETNVEWQINPRKMKFCRDLHLYFEQ